MRPFGQCRGLVPVRQDFPPSPPDASRPDAPCGMLTRCAVDAPARLYREYDAVFVGDYAPHGGGIRRGMRRAMNNQSLIGRFKETLAWMAARSGKVYGEWDEEGSTRTCGYKVLGGIAPAIREWTCPSCGAHHLRDENAAMNGLAHILKKVEVPCSGRPGGRKAVWTRRAWRFDGLGIQEMPGAVGGRVG